MIRKGLREVRGLFPPIGEADPETLEDKRARLLQALTQLRRAQTEIGKRQRVLANRRTGAATCERVESEIDDIRTRAAQRVRDTGLVKPFIWGLGDPIEAFVEAIDDQRQIITRILKPYRLSDDEEFLEISAPRRRPRGDLDHREGSQRRAQAHSEARVGAPLHAGGGDRQPRRDQDGP
jgi:hypothetical protein